MVIKPHLPLRKVKFLLSFKVNNSMGTKFNEKSSVLSFTKASIINSVQKLSEENIPRKVYGMPGLISRKYSETKVVLGSY